MSDDRWRENPLFADYGEPSRWRKSRYMARWRGLSDKMAKEIIRRLPDLTKEATYHTFHFDQILIVETNHAPDLVALRLAFPTIS